MDCLSLEAAHHDKLSTIGFKLKRSGINNVTDVVGVSIRETPRAHQSLDMLLTDPMGAIVSTDAWRDPPFRPLRCFVDFYQQWIAFRGVRRMFG